ncbi:MAG: ADP-ribosylglycohydrolase family protein [Tepidisphaeraceae bacterium]
MRILLLFWLFAASLTLSSPARAEEMRDVPLEELRDKVRGAWAGKMVGVAIGFPTEFKFRGTVVPDSAMPTWKPEMIRDALRQDDLYVQMAFAQVLDERGLDATTEQFAAMFRDSQFPLWHASQAARRALRRGAPPLETGTPKYNTHGNDIAFQINADFAGLMCPGLPQASNDLIARAGRVTCWGDGVYGGIFVAGMYTRAFFETDPRKVVEAGLACVPPESDYGKAIADVLAWSKEHPDDWQATWRRVNEKWDHQDRCPYGALEPLNIDAKINGAYLAIGLLYGGGEFYKTIDIATRCGQDSDCNPSTAAGIWGAMHGFKAIPEQYKSGLAEIAHERFTFTPFTFDGIVESTLKNAVSFVKRNGGRVDERVLTIKTQEPKSTAVPQYAIGKPAERVACEDPRWMWTGAWTREVTSKTGPERLATEQGATATIGFDGTGAIICGPYVPAGGTGDVFIDGKLDRTVDVLDDDGRRKVMEAVWHRFDLSPGKHTLKLVVRGKPFGNSKGSEIRVHSLIVYR